MSLPDNVLTEEYGYIKQVSIETLKETLGPISVEDLPIDDLKETLGITPIETLLQDLLNETQLLKNVMKKKDDVSLNQIDTAALSTLDNVLTFSSGTINTASADDLKETLGLSPIESFKEILGIRSPKAIVSNFSSSFVSIVDLATGAITDVGNKNNMRESAVTPDKTKVCVASNGGDRLLIIDLFTNEVLHEVAVGDAPYHVRMTADGNIAYVTLLNDNALAVVEIATGTVLDTIAIGLRPTFMEITPDDSKIVALDDAALSAAVIDLATRTVVDTVTVETDPGFVAMSADSAYAVITNEDSDSITVINLSDASATTIAAGDEPIRAVSSVDGSKMYISNNNSHDVTVLTFSTMSTSIIDLDSESGAQEIAMSPDGKYLCVLSRSSDAVTIIDTATDTVNSHVDVGNNPRCIVVSPDSSKFCTMSYSGELFYVGVLPQTIPTATLIVTVPMGPKCYTCGFSSDGTKAMAVSANSTDSSFTVVDMITLKATQITATGSNPKFLSFT
jgi:YVTN family beta-propeller protein